MCSGHSVPPAPASCLPASQLEAGHVLRGTAQCQLKDLGGTLEWLCQAGGAARSSSSPLLSLGPYLSVR